MKTFLRKLFGASASRGVIGGFYLLALTGLSVALPNTARGQEAEAALHARYLRVSITHAQTSSENAGGGSSGDPFGFAIGEMRFFNGEEQVDPKSVTANIDGRSSDAQEDRLINGEYGEGNNDKFWVAASAVSDLSGITLPSFTFDFGDGGVDLTRYILTMADVRYRHPVAWTVEVSDDNSTWVRVDRVDYHGVANVPDPFADVERPLLAQERARYVRFLFTDWQTPGRTCEPGYGDNYYGLEFSEFRLFRGDNDLTDGITPTANYLGESGYAFANAHDGNHRNSYWIANQTLEGGDIPWVQFDLGQPTDIDSYLITLRSRYCIPLAWRVELSDDGQNWRVWDTHAYASVDDVPTAYATVVVYPKPEWEIPAGKQARAWQFIRFTSDTHPSDGVALGAFEPLYKGRPVLPGTGITVSGAGTYGDTSWADIFNGDFCGANGNEKGWSQASSVTFTADLGRPIAFDGYRIQLADHGPRNPYDWTVEVSADGTTWETFDRQNFATHGAGTAYFGSASTTSTNTKVANLFTWRDFQGDPAVAYEDATTIDAALTGRSVSFVLGACGQSGAKDLSGNGLYGIAPYQVSGDGWNNLAVSGTDAYTLESAHDNTGAEVEGMTFTVAANHGDLLAVTAEDSPDYTASNGVMARGYCLLQEGTETMAVLRSKSSNRGDIGSDTFDEFTITGVPYAKFTAVLYLGRGVYTAKADGHDPVVVNQTWNVGTGGGSPVKRNIKYTYVDGKLSVVETEGDETSKEGLWGDPSIAWSNEVGSGVMVIPNLTPDANGNFSFNISWKNHGTQSTSARTMFRGVQLVEQSATWHEPLAAGTGSVGFVFQKSGSTWDDDALYGMDGRALHGSGWNKLTSHAQTLAAGSVIDRDGAVVEGMTMALTRVSGNMSIDKAGSNNAALPPFDTDTPYTQCNARVALNGIPYGTYSLVLYLGKDKGWYASGRKIGAVKVTAGGATTSYTYKDGKLAIGTEDWGAYGQAGIVGQEGIGVMVIPGLTASSLTFETTGGDRNSQLQGFQIVEEADAEAGSGLLHAFHFDELDSVESRDVAPIVDIGDDSFLATLCAMKRPEGSETPVYSFEPRELSRLRWQAISESNGVSLAIIAGHPSNPQVAEVFGKEGIRSVVWNCHNYQMEDHCVMEALSYWCMVNSMRGSALEGR